MNRDGPWDENKIRFECSMGGGGFFPNKGRKPYRGENKKSMKQTQYKERSHHSNGIPKAYKGGSVNMDDYNTNKSIHLKSPDQESQSSNPNNRRRDTSVGSTVSSGSSNTSQMGLKHNQSRQQRHQYGTNLSPSEVMEFIASIKDATEDRRFLQQFRQYSAVDAAHVSSLLEEISMQEHQQADRRQ